jgi:hypothetical protein
MMIQRGREARGLRKYKKLPSPIRLRENTDREVMNWFGSFSQIRAVIRMPENNPMMTIRFGYRFFDESGDAGGRMLVLPCAVMGLLGYYALFSTNLS